MVTLWSKSSGLDEQTLQMPHAKVGYVHIDCKKFANVSKNVESICKRSAAQVATTSPHIQRCLARCSLLGGETGYALPSYCPALGETHFAFSCWLLRANARASNSYLVVALTHTICPKLNLTPSPKLTPPTANHTVHGSFSTSTDITKP